MAVRASISTEELGNFIAVLLSEKQYEIQRLVADSGQKKFLQVQLARLVAGLTEFQVDSIRGDGTIEFKVPDYLDVKRCSDLGVWFQYRQEGHEKGTRESTGD